MAKDFKLGNPIPPSMPMTKETDYMGKFRKTKFLIPGHNSNKTSNILAAVSSGLGSAALLTASMTGGPSKPKIEEDENDTHKTIPTSKLDAGLDEKFRPLRPKKGKGTAIV